MGEGERERESERESRDTGLKLKGVLKTASVYVCGPLKHAATLNIPVCATLIVTLSFLLLHYSLLLE